MAASVLATPSIEEAVSPSLRPAARSIDPDEYYMALGRVSHTSNTTSPQRNTRQINPAANLPTRPLPSVEEFKEIQSLSDMLEVVQQDSDLNHLRIQAELARERSQMNSLSNMGGRFDPILSNASEAYFDMDVPVTQ